VASLRHFRRLCIPCERSSRAFDAYLWMACVFLLVRQTLGPAGNEGCGLPLMEGSG